VPLPASAPPFAGELPASVADLLAAEVGPCVFAIGSDFVLAPEGRLAAAAATLWTAASALNPEGDRLWVSSLAGGLIVARLTDAVLLAVTANAASELAARNLWLNQLQAEALRGSGG
jgi:hypothetical protein